MRRRLLVVPLYLTLASCLVAGNHRSSAAEEQPAASAAAATYEPFKVKAEGLSDLEFKIKQDHPRFWLTPERIKVLQGKAQAKTYDFQVFQACVDTYYFDSYSPQIPTCWGNGKLPALALLWQTTREKKYLDQAKKILLEVARTHFHSKMTSNTMRHCGVWYPLAFDWLYNDLTEEERKECVEELELGLKAIKPGTIGLRWYDGDQMTGEWSAAVLSAVAIYGHKDTAKGWLEHYFSDNSQWRIEKEYIRNAEGGFGRDGAAYCKGTFCYSLFAHEGLLTAAGVDVWKGILPEEGYWPTQIVYFLIYSTTPGGGPVMYGDFEGLSGWWWKNKSEHDWVLAGLNMGLLDRNSREAGFTRYHIDSVLGESKAMQVIEFFLGYDNTVPPRDYTKELPTDYFAAGQGFVVARSDWNKDASLVTFQCSNTPLDHTHPEQGSFMLYRKAWWLSKEFTSYGGYGGAPEAHNVMLLWNLGAPHIGARMLAFKPGKDYVYAVASASGPHRTWGYQPPSAYVKSYTRSFLYLKPDLVVILDRSELGEKPDAKMVERYIQVLEGGPDNLKSAKYSREFVLHMPVKPEWSEKEQLLTAKFDEGNQMLYARTLLPKEAACEVIDLKEQFKDLGDKGNAGNPPCERKWMTRTRSAKDPEGAEVFLTVVYGADLGKAMLPVKLLEKGGQVGIEAVDGDTRWTALFNTTGGDGAELKIERGGKVAVEEKLSCKIDWIPPWQEVPPRRP